VLQKLANVGGIIALFAGLFMAYNAMEYGFKWTLGPFDDIAVQYKWMDGKSGERNCVAHAPGERPTLCKQKTKEELNEYKLLWKEPPQNVLAQVARTRNE